MDREKEMRKNMSRFQKIAAKLDQYGLDAMMITSEPNRLYATEFHSTAGMVIICWIEQDNVLKCLAWYLETDKCILGIIISVVIVVVIVDDDDNGIIIINLLTNHYNG